MIAAAPMQGESSAVPRNERLSGRARGTLWGQKGQIDATQRHMGTCSRQIRRLTFSRTGCDVGLHLGTIGERLGPDTEVVGDAVCQVFDLHPQGGAALHIYRHNLTDTWSARRGVCAQNTKTLDAAFHKRQAEICAGEQTDNTLKFRQTIGDKHILAE